jgi:hypothetical protein
MRSGVSVSAVGHSTSLLLVIAFVLCVGSDLLFPSRAMYGAWQALLPGFKWISWPAFLLGGVEAYGYGWFVALIWVPLYNVFALRRTGPAASL